MKPIFFGLIAALLAGLAAEAPAAEFQIDKSGKNRVQFLSQATLETITGVTDRIDGYILYAGPDSLAASEIHIEVQLDQIDTGISLRNRHMRENYLETEKHPLAVFHGKATAVRQDSLNHYQVSAKGKFSLHGVDRELVVTAAVKVEGQRARVSTAFDVRLADYGIEVPKLMFMKLSEVLAITVDFAIVPVQP